MEWERTSASARNGDMRREEREEEEEMGEEVLYVKVMTDEQMEILRRQIAVYATICEQLVEMHKTVSAQQDSLSGMWFGSLYCDPLLTSSSHKIAARQRWTPSPMQLQILENIFVEGNGTPSKEKIKEITTELTKHGHISETNVYNWLQNRRARSKRKQTSAAASNTESEAGIEIELPNDKKARPDAAFSHEKQPQRVDDPSFQDTEMNSLVHSLYPETTKLRAHMSYLEASLSNPRTDNLMGRMDYTGMDHLMGKIDYSWEL
uniref:WUSCHEL-related homeobox 8 n=1 Tax=Paphiopedilum callosum TaxID=53075 RepID=A0A8F5Y0T7_9ASPA|nr:WUSCHEL-related homeobox 8 [Paphiopedilum callosum]